MGPLRRDVSPKLSRKRLIKSILKLKERAVQIFPNDDPRTYATEVRTGTNGIHGRVSVRVLPNTPSWETWQVALRSDGVILVAEDFYDPARQPDHGIQVTDRHLVPRRLGKLSRTELKAVLRHLQSIAGVRQS